MWSVRALVELTARRSFSTTGTRLVHGQRKATGDPDFKTYKPVTPGLRQLRLPRNEHLWKGRAHLPLTEPKRKTGGRDNTGRIRVRHIGGGHKQRLRDVDFQRRQGGEQTVVRIEYDPGRSGHIALIKHNESGALSYILAPEGLRAGDAVQSFRSGIPTGFATSEMLSSQISPEEGSSSAPVGGVGAGGAVSQDSSTSARDAASSTLELGFLRQMTLKPGNFLPLRLIPVGATIHAIALVPHGKASLARSAGTSGRVIAHDSRGGEYAQVRLSSGEVRFIHMDACASIGRVSNRHHQGTKLGKAGRSRWMGIRPRVRGVAMNKRDHPLGGGRGKSKSNRQPVSPTGVLAKGGRTRRPGPRGNRMVVKQRTKGPHVGR